MHRTTISIFLQNQDRGSFIVFRIIFYNNTRTSPFNDISCKQSIFRKLIIAMF